MCSQKYPRGPGFFIIGEALTKWKHYCYSFKDPLESRHASDELVEQMRNVFIGGQSLLEEPHGKEAGASPGDQVFAFGRKEALCMSGACHRFLCWLSSHGLLSRSHRVNGKVHSLKVQPEHPWCPGSSALGALRQSSPLLPVHTQPHGTAGGAGASSLAREQGGFCSVNLGDTAVPVRCHGNSEGARADGVGGHRSTE